MAISFVGGGGGATINGGNVTASFGSGVAGDVVYVAVNTTSVAPTVSGYTLIASQVAATNTLRIYRKVLTASASSVTVIGNATTSAVTAVSAFLIRGLDPFVPEDIISSGATGASTNPNPPSVTTVTAGTRALVFAGSQINDTSVSAPSGYGNLQGASNTDTTPSSCWGAFRSSNITSRSTVENPATFSNWSSGSWASFTIILREKTDTLYWVGGTGTWTVSDSNRWSLTSGGTTGYIPSGATDVIFDGSSDADGGLTVTVGPAVSCKNFSTSGLDRTMTLAGTGAWLIYGDMTLPSSNFTRTYTGNMFFYNTNNITTNGVSLASNIQIFGNMVLLGALTTTGGFTLNDASSLSLGSYTLTCFTLGDSDIFDIYTLDFGTGKIVINRTSGTGTSFNFQTVYGTYLGTKLIETTGTASHAVFFGGSETTVLNLSILSTSGTITVGSISYIGNLIIADNSITVPLNSLTLYGNLTVLGSTPLISTTLLTFAGTSGTKTITTNGDTLDCGIEFDGAGCTWQLQDALTLGATRKATLRSGTLNLNDYTLTSPSGFNVTGSDVKVLAHGSGDLIIPVSGGSAFLATGVNLTSTGTGKISMTSASAKTFVGNGNSYATLNQGGAGNLTISGSNTFKNITNSVQPATVLFTSGTTQTFTDNFQLSGTSGNLITIQSTTASTHTLSKSSGTVEVSFCSIINSIATGGASWYASVTNGNVDAGNNTGWSFAAIVAATSSAFLLMFL